MFVGLEYCLLLLLTRYCIIKDVLLGVAISGSVIRQFIAIYFSNYPKKKYKFTRINIKVHESRETELEKIRLL